MNDKKHDEIVIVGGGASGVMCAIKCKKNNPQAKVTIIEQNDRILKKLLKTGNGKCNIMNSNIQDVFYNDFSLIEANKHIDVYQELKDLGIILKETTLGRVYPYSEQATTVVNLLMIHLKKLGVDIITKTTVLDIKKENNIFIINTNNSLNSTLFANKLVMATGSISQEKTNGYNILKKLGLSVSTLDPGLVSFETMEKTDHLLGIKLKCDAYISGKKTPKLTGEILFKSNGISGILALDISRFLSEKDKVYFDIMKEYSQDEIVDLLNTNNGLTTLEKLEGMFPKMVARDLIQRCNESKEKLAYEIKHYSFTVKKKKDFSESQITLGGVELHEVDNNFEAKKINNLFITGELLNCDGASGGYNLYFAWLSGIVVANKIF